MNDPGVFEVQERKRRARSSQGGPLLCRRLEALGVDRVSCKQKRSDMPKESKGHEDQRQGSGQPPRPGSVADSLQIQQCQRNRPKQGHMFYAETHSHKKDANSQPVWVFRASSPEIAEQCSQLEKDQAKVVLGHAAGPMEKGNRGSQDHADGGGQGADLANTRHCKRQQEGECKEKGVHDLRSGLSA